MCLATGCSELDLQTFSNAAEEGLHDKEPDFIESRASKMLSNPSQTSIRSDRRKRKSSVATVSLSSADKEHENCKSAPSKKLKTSHSTDFRELITSKGFKRHFATHNYHDYGRLRPSETDLENAAKASKGGAHTPFPVVLHSLMDDADIKGFRECISWQPHGRAFLIKDPKTFVADVLPIYFKHAKLSSFQRQLSLYGFARLTSDGPDRGAYYHECFLRARPFLCTRIRRTRVKGTWVRTSSSPEQEPNFYLMESLCDLYDVCSEQSDEGGSTSICTESDSEPINQTRVPGSVEISFELSACTISVSSLQAASSHTNIRDDLILLRRDEKQQSATTAFATSAMGPPPVLPSYVVDDGNRLPSTSRSSVKVDYCNFDGSYNHKALCIESVKRPDKLDRRQENDTSAHQTSFFEDDEELATFLTDMDLDLELDASEVYYRLLA